MFMTTTTTTILAPIETILPIVMVSAVVFPSSKRDRSDEILEPTHTHSFAKELSM